MSRGKILLLTPLLLTKVFFPTCGGQAMWTMELSVYTRKYQPALKSTNNYTSGYQGTRKCIVTCLASPCLHTH